MALADELWKLQELHQRGEAGKTERNGLVHSGNRGNRESPIPPHRGLQDAQDGTGVPNPRIIPGFR